MHNVTAFDASGTWLRIWSDEGLSILDPAKILYHQVRPETREDEAQALQEESREESREEFHPLGPTSEELAALRKAMHADPDEPARPFGAVDMAAVRAATSWMT